MHRFNNLFLEDNRAVIDCMLNYLQLINESIIPLDENVNNNYELNVISNDINKYAAAHKNYNKKVDMMIKVRSHVMILIQ